MGIDHKYVAAFTKIAALHGTAHRELFLLDTIDQRPTDGFSGRVDGTGRGVTGPRGARSTQRFLSEKEADVKSGETPSARRRTFRTRGMGKTPGPAVEALKSADWRGCMRLVFPMHSSSKSRMDIWNTRTLILPRLLDAFRSSTNEAAGKAMVNALLKSQVTIGEPDAERLQEILGKYPADVRTAARPLLARLLELQKARIERLRQLEPLLSAGGDISRGRRVFFGEKVACYHCHTLGNQGGHVGPDLTAVGAICSGHDILEAIVFPSASFVPGFEIYNVETKSDTYSGVRGGDTPEAITLVTGPDAEIRIPRKQIVSIKPSNVSLMPEGLDESITRAEFIDLLAFLQPQKSRETAQLRPAEIH